MIISAATDNFYNMIASLVSLLALIVTIGVLKFARIFLQFRKQWNQVRNVPGPKSHWFFGNAKLFFDEKTGKPCSKVAWSVLPSIAKQYDGVFKLGMGFQPFVYIHKPEYVEALLSSSKLIEKGIDYDSLQNWLGNGLLTSKGAKWRAHRKLLTP